MVPSGLELEMPELGGTLVITAQPGREPDPRRMCLSKIGLDFFERPKQSYSLRKEGNKKNSREEVSLK